MQGVEVSRDEEIRQLAYGLWQEAGCPEGYDVQHWLEAEMIWLEKHRPKSDPKQTKPVKAKRAGRQTRRPAAQEL